MTQGKMLVIKVTGKASQVFKYINLLAKYQGTKSLDEIIRGKEVE